MTARPRRGAGGSRPGWPPPAPALPDRPCCAGSGSAARPRPRSATSSAHSAERRNAPAKPRHSSARSRRPIMLSGHKATIWPIRSAVAGALPCLALPMVRRMPQDCPDALAAGWRLVAGHLVVVADRCRPATDRAGLAAAVGEAGEVGGDDPLVRWQGCGAPQSAPGGEVAASRTHTPPGSPAPSPPPRRPWSRRSRRW
jgi:hypothetical protein